VLRVECTKCDRKGRYHVHKLIEKYGRQGNLMKWREMLTADIARRLAGRAHPREAFRRESWRELPGDRIEFTMRRLPSAD
jgi:hypothetical protein